MRSVPLVALTFANSAAGFAMQVLIAKRFGVGATSDAYYRALAVPLFCVGLFAAQSTFRAVPALMLRGLDGPGAWLGSARSYVATAAALGLVVAIGGGIASAGIPAIHPATTRSDGWLEPLCWTYAAAQFPLVALSALLQSMHRYATALVIIGVPQVVAVTVVFGVRGLDISAIPFLLAVATVACAMWTWVTISRASSGVTPMAGSRFGLRILVEAPYTLATLACFSLYAVIDALVLPRYAPGFLTIASFCQRLVIGLGQLMIAAPLTLITKELVQEVATRDARRLERIVGHAIRRVIVQASLLGVVLYVSAPLLLQLALTSRAGGSLDVATAVRTLRLMLPGMVLMLASNLLVRSALSIPRLVRRTWWLGIAWGLVYGTALLVFSAPLTNGSGPAYSLSWAVSFVVLAVYIRRRLPAALTA